MFAKYAALVKNLRGVVLFDLREEGVKNSIKWLMNRFKYKNLGLPPSLFEKYKDELKDYLKGRPLRRIVYPVIELKDMAEILSNNFSTPFEVFEALILASSYISPLLVLGSRFIPYIESLSSEVVRICKDKVMDVRQWKLHLRIADYSIIDIYEQSVMEAMEVISKFKLGSLEIEQILRNRREKIKIDTNRYWRIKCSKGKPFLYYVDMLSVVKNMLKYLSENHAAGLSIVPVVHISP